MMCRNNYIFSDFVSFRGPSLSLELFLSSLGVAIGLMRVGAREAVEHAQGSPNNEELSDPNTNSANVEKPHYNLTLKLSGYFMSVILIQMAKIYFLKYMLMSL